MATAAIGSNTTGSSPSKRGVFAIKDDDEFAYRSYRRQWNEQFLYSSQPRQDHKRLRQQSLATEPTMVVFGVCWYQASTDHNDNDNNNDKDNDDKILWLLACTNQGQVCVFSVPSHNPYLVDDNDDEEEEEMDYWNSTNHNTMSRPKPAWNRMPLAQWKVSHGVLYSIQITTFGSNPGKEWLVVSGDEGVLMWEWTPQVPALLQRQYQRHQQQQQASMAASSCSKTPPPLPPLQRVTHLQPPPWSRWERSEVNDVACSDPFVYGATGHAAGTKWNVETQQLVATYSSQMTMTSTSTTPMKRGGGGSWHALSLVPACDTTMTDPNATDAFSNHKWLLAGGEEGLLQVWDVQQDALVDQLDVVTAAVSSSSSLSGGRTMSPPKRTTTNTTTPTTHGWISSIVPVSSGRDDHSCSWWTVAGGWHAPPSRGTGTLSLGGGSDPRGFVTTWHAPTRTLVTSTGTPSPIHQLATTGGEGLWAVGTGRRLSHQEEEDCSTQTPVVSVWNNPWSLQTDATTSNTAPPLSPGCGYAVATTRVVHQRSSSSSRTHHSDDDNHNNQDDEQWWVATGGVGTTVFVLDGTTQHVVFQCSIPLSSSSSSSSSSQGWDPIEPS